MSWRNLTAAKRPFSFPHEVIDDPSLNNREKREILAEWASDACAIESFPTLRLLPGTSFPVTLSSVLDALANLDAREAGPGRGAAFALSDRQGDRVIPSAATIAAFPNRNAGARSWR